ncbi:MAG: hypothetical protein JO257_35190 [Deltaproteobacteria bacterium]|nr:hypothetical protein [Deltaproteobacteria bacterium]
MHFGLHETDPVAQRVDSTNQRNGIEQTRLASERAKLCTSDLALTRNGMGVDDERRMLDQRGEQAAATRADATVRDYDSVLLLHRATRGFDDARIDLERRERRVTRNDARDRRQLGVQRKVAVHECEDARRDLERLPILGRRRDSIRTLDEPERAKRCVRTELVPDARTRCAAVDDAADDVERDVSDLLGRDRADRAANRGIEIVRKKQPQHPHLRLGQREPRFENKNRQRHACGARRLDACQKRAGDRGERIVAQLRSDPRDVRGGEFLGRFEGRVHAPLIGRSSPELRGGDSSRESDAYGFSSNSMHSSSPHISGGCGIMCGAIQLFQ